MLLLQIAFIVIATEIESKTTEIESKESRELTLQRKIQKRNTFHQESVSFYVTCKQTDTM